MNNTLKVKYTIMQSLYWLLFCPGIAYMNTFLTSSGYTPSAIGVISALAGTLSALLQPYLGKLADKSECFSWKTQLCFMSLTCAVCNISVFIFEKSFITAQIYSLFFMLIYAMMPFLNGAAFYYEVRGIDLNFGFARGMGSLCYALGAFFMGKCVSVYGANIIPAVSAAVSVLLFIFILTMPLFDSNTKAKSTQNESKASIGEFFKEAPSFMLMLLAFTLFTAFHNMTGTYMLQIIQRAQGSDAQMGTAVALAAMTELIPLFLFSRISKKFSSMKLLFISAMFFFFKAVMLFFAHSMPSVYFAQSLQMLGYGLFTPSSVYYVNNSVPSNRKMHAQSLLAGSITLGGVLGNLIGGVLIQSFGIDTNLITAVFVTIAGVGITIVCKNLKEFPGK